MKLGKFLEQNPDTVFTLKNSYCDDYDFVMVAKGKIMKNNLKYTARNEEIIKVENDIIYIK